jgi:hypothetical protein
MRSACLAAALGLASAATDVSPPVISLSLASGDYADRNCQTHACTKKNAAGHESATCEVGTTAVPASASCLLPTCKAYDHHEGSFGCVSVFKMVNNDGAVVAAPVPEASVNKDLRSEWLLTYDAADKSGNAADTISFTMIFQDTVKPVLTTPLGGTDAARTIRSTGSNFAESCSQGGRTAPCTYNVARTASSTDNYDDAASVTADIRVRLTHPNKPASAWAYQKDLTSLVIDTQEDRAFWTLEYTSNDHAGIFGFGETDNVVTQTVKIYVQDTIAPIITQAAHGAGHTLECGDSTYAEPGANCEDLRDQWNPATAKYDAKAATIGGDTVDTDTISADLSQVKVYSVTYNCADAAGNAATESVRDVTVQDTTAPAIALVGPSFIENSMGAHDNTENPSSYEGASGLRVDKLVAATGATCSDKCDQNPTVVATLHYGPTCGDKLVAGGVTAFPELVPGDFSIKYVCSDGNAGDTRTALTSSVCRRIFNQDYTKPVLNMLGDEDMTLEASHTGNYIDDGATCSDQVDGVISQNVEVSGDVVNIAKVGTYVITYNCQDARGNFAPTMTRNVHVQQTTCPTCTLVGSSEQDHEASFPYTDLGATCADIIDGPVATVVKTDEAVNVEKAGTYYLTYRAVNAVGLWNDGSCMRNGGLSTNAAPVRTIVIKDTLKPVIQVKYKGVEVGRSDPTNVGTGTNGESNDAYDEGVKAGSFMAEESTSSANGWVIGAVASAVTGLALLGLSQRKATVTTVPV